MSGETESWPVATALRLVDESGFESVTIRSVAARAGYTPMAVYRHVADLDELLRIVVRRIFEDWESRAYTVLDESDPVERLRRAAEVYREYAARYPHRYEILFVLRHGIGTHRFPAGFRETPATTFEILVEAVREGIDQSVLTPDDPVEVALLFWSAAHGLVMLERSGRFEDDAAFARLYARSIDRLLASMIPATAEGASIRDGAADERDT